MVTLSPATGIAAGTAIGAGYFAISESGVPKESNCTYLAPWTTDFAAWLAGIVLIKKGLDYQDPMITFIGSLVVSIHVAQFAAHKVILNRIIS